MTTETVAATTPLRVGWGLVYDPDTGVWTVQDDEGGYLTEGHADPEGAIAEAEKLHGGTR